MEGAEVTRAGSSKHYQLDDTEISQPAIFISTALAYQVHAQNLDLKNCIFAGYSLGEFAALYAAEKLDFLDALCLTLFRGQAMQRDCRQAKTGLVTVITRGKQHTSIKRALLECRQNEQEILHVSAH